jgi:hypothetical protein
VRFRFAGAVQTVCGYCRSILVRTDIDLRKVGETAELADHSPVQLGTKGLYRDRRFTVVGRIAYEYAQGGWSEWHLAFADGRSGWLSDAQAEYAVTFPVKSEAIPLQKEIYRGKRLTLDTRSLEVTTLTQARYAGVEGDLPFEYWDKSEILFADLRSSTRHFATIDYSEEPPLVFAGEFVDFADLKLKNLREMDATELAAGPRALNCPSCGAAVEIRGHGRTMTAVCVQCLSVLDLTSPALAVLQQFQAKQRVIPLIPLGRKGKLHGDEYEVIGFQTRFIEVEGTQYEWREYVLFHAEKGFRYLTEFDGHWNDVKPLQGVPKGTSKGRRPGRHWDGMKFLHFQRAVAQTSYVMGEFPWVVTVGERNEVNDFVSPPFLLSSEATENETTWSLGEYVPGARIWEAFQLPGSPPSPRGIYVNQPSPYKGRVTGVWALAFWMAGMLLVSGIVTVALMSGKEVFRRSYSFAPGRVQEEASFVTPVFELDGRPSNVEVRIETDLANAWAYFGLALINETTGQAYDWGREVSYYSGPDWTEGNRRDISVVSPVPAGRYYLRVEPESQPDPGRAPQMVHYTIQVRRDVPAYWPYAIALVLLLVPPAVRSIQAGRFESQRWQESDYGGNE